MASARTDFEIRREEGGFFVFSMSSWWNKDEQVASAGGQTRSLPFPTAAAAKAWIREQFAVPINQWRRRNTKTFVAGIGDDLPESQQQTITGKHKRQVVRVSAKQPQAKAKVKENEAKPERRNNKG